ncbi:MAG: leucyl aminopeptidase [Burkholderiales bacterium]|nr:leucyl aminopeptidase [Burkholderiales bacterium]
MNFELKTLSLAAASKQRTDTLIVLISDQFQAGLDPLSTLISKAIKAKDFSSKSGQMLHAYDSPGISAAKVIALGIGKGSPQDIKSALNALIPSLKSSETQALCLVLTEAGNAQRIQSVLVSLADGTYVYGTTQSKPVSRSLRQVTLGLPSTTAALESAFKTTVAMISGIELAKEWANRPANHATPSMLGKAAQAMAKSAAISCEVLGPKEVAKLGMGSFMSVAQGSAEPLRFIVLKYQGGAKTEAPTVLVGKGITFDTGGISLKPAPEMDEMKFDMGGAASVLGVFHALSQIKPKINVVGLIPACENMPDGLAVKPGDVVTSMSGQTIEILNTDAEGRLILCDALTYAERFKPKAVIDIATLTGACVIALGAVRSGMFATEDDLAHRLQQAGDDANDLCWRLPLDDAYAEALKSNFADVANVGGRAGGAITAAKFLHRFTKKYPWAHLDIAGTAWKGGAAKGATGRPVGLLLHYLLSQASTPAKSTTKALNKSPK